MNEDYEQYPPSPTSTASHASQLPSATCPPRVDNLSCLGDEITEISAHLTAGSYQLLELIRVATAHNEDALLNVALHGTAAHVEALRSEN